MAVLNQVDLENKEDIVNLLQNKALGFELDAKDMHTFYKALVQLREEYSNSKHKKASLKNLKLKFKKYSQRCGRSVVV